MSYKGFIYKYTSPSGKIYIGQTTKDPKKRAGYKGRGYSGTVFGNAIKKYGFENFKLEILHIVEDDSVENLINKLNKLEENEILKNNSLLPNGYNSKYGGNNHKLADEIKEKIRQTKIQQSKDENYRKMISEKTREAMSNPEIRKKCSSRVGSHTIHSEETKQKISNILKNSIKVKVNSEFSNSHKFHVNFCEECFRMFESNSNRRFCSRSCSRKNYIRVNGISEEFLSHKPSMLGKHHSEETKEKLRLAAIKQWKRQKGIT